ncbi:hypothetical protein BGX38DRAFT_1137049 [Terfezia claveryi]|nr:hypothetical protein BGX38DRAFT_1137049 [Terfezia claveryi]
MMLRLGNSNGGMSPLALRTLYTGCIRPIFLWGAELWFRPSFPHQNDTRLSGMELLEYQALRKICGAYHGSSKDKLALIVNVEPLEAKLQDMLVCCLLARGFYGIIQFLLASGSTSARFYFSSTCEGFVRVEVILVRDLAYGVSTGERFLILSFSPARGFFTFTGRKALFCSSGLQSGPSGSSGTAG